MNEPRITPLEPPYAPEIDAMLRKWMPPGSSTEPLTLFRVLCVHDELSARMRPLGAGILGHGRVQAHDREIMILRTCARCGAEYEWGVHAVAFAAQVGLSQEQVAATATGDADDPAWSEHEALLIRLADELHERCDVSDAAFAQLQARYTADQLLELVIIAGWYRLLSGVIHAARLPREPWAATFPAGQLCHAHRRIY